MRANCTFPRGFNRHKDHGRNEAFGVPSSHSSHSLPPPIGGSSSRGSLACVLTSDSRWWVSPLFPFVFMHGAWSYARLFWTLTENAGEINLAAVGGGCAVHCWGV